MSTTALVRSSSSSNNLTAPSPQSRLPSPSAISTANLPKLSLTPQSKEIIAKTTPQQQASPAVSTPTGRWQHPRMDEVIRRQNRSNFDRSNTRSILRNVGFIAASFLAPSMMHAVLPMPWAKAIHPYGPSYALLILRLILLINIAIALSPIFRKPDTCEDIPLTPSQRQLLGLPPMSRPATPQEKEQYVTPPRYSRSNTPKGRSSSSSSLRAEVSGSPSSAFGTPLSDSTFRGASPSQPSSRRVSSNDPLQRRLNYAASRTNSPLSTSEFDAAGSVNTPTRNNRASVGLNSKWLYEKGRASPTGSASGWGTGSVFS